MTGTPAAPGGDVTGRGEVSDGDLVRLARDGDQVAFRLLVERHQPMARARARRLSANPSDIDDIVQESFLQAFIALDRLQDADRFAGWLAGVVFNVCRNLRRRDQPALVSDWPESLHPAAADGQPSAEDLDRAETLRAAVAGLPAGQRHAVTLHYYADLPPAQIANSAGAARVSLHKARLQLRAYLTRHRPDLVPAASGRIPMNTVRIARVERRVPPGPVPDSVPTDVVVLVDDTGRRELPVWLLARYGNRLSPVAGPAAETRVRAATAAARTPDELTRRLLRAADASVARVDIDELGPGVTAARIGLATPAGTRYVTARVGDGLAIAATAGAPIRVSETVLDRLAAQAGADSPGPLPAPTANALQLGRRPRYEPRNMRFADGLDRWLLGGSFAEHASESHWHDYTCAAEHGIAVLSAAVPRPDGFAFLAQEMFADDYLGDVIVFRGEFLTEDTAGRTGLFLRVRRELDIGTGRDIRGPLTEEAALADPSNHIVTITSSGGWTGHEVSARIPDDCTTVAFGVFLSGPGRIELRDAELTRAT